MGFGSKLGSMGLSLIPNPRILGFLGEFYSLGLGLGLLGPPFGSMGNRQFKKFELKW